MERLVGKTDNIKKRGKEREKHWVLFCLPTYTLPYPLLQLTGLSDPR